METPNPAPEPDQGGPRPETYPDHPDLLHGDPKPVDLNVPDDPLPFNDAETIKARSPEAVFAFFTAQDGLGEPGGQNKNWITHACHLDGAAWCIMACSLAYLAAGFNETGQMLDFGSPSQPPSWAATLPKMAGIGIATTYNWGSAYAWTVANNADAAGRWTTNVDEGMPGDWMIINFNGKGKVRDDHSHGCVAIAKQADGTWLAWNGNWGDKITKATFDPSIIEGFARPAFGPTQEDDLSSAADDIKAHIDATVRDVEAHLDKHLNDIARDLMNAIKALHAAPPAP